MATPVDEGLTLWWAPDTAVPVRGGCAMGGRRGTMPGRWCGAIVSPAGADPTVALSLKGLKPA